jgi:rare lipoprotein A
MDPRSHHPSSRKRLRAFNRLKARNRWAIGAIALLLPATAAFALGGVEGSRETGGVPRDKGLAGISASTDSLIPDIRSSDASAALPPQPSEVEEGQDGALTSVMRPLDGGMASYYGSRFAGRLTASGERFDARALTAAHRTLPFGSKVRVTNRRNGKSVIVRINDRGPFHGARVIDLSKAAAQEIGLIRRGRANVNLSLLID